LIFGHEAIPGISTEFASCFSFLKTIDSMQTFLEAENEAFKKQEAAREIIRAQDTLLSMGVPVTGESLAQCTSDGLVQEISLFLAAGFSPDTRNKTGVPLLNIAARNGNHEVLKLLIQSGAEVNLTADDRGSSALIDGTIGRYFDIVTDLIESGAIVDMKSKDGQTALLIAVGADDEAVVEALLKAGANLDISDSLGLSARKYATLYHKSSMLALFARYTG
jgi:ankyrin repeat protein